MEEGDMEDTTTLSRDDSRAQGKQGEFLTECRNVVETSGRVMPREEESRRSSVQQFVDLLDGKDPDSSASVVDASQNPCTAYGECGEGRVQELTLGHCNSGFPMMDGGGMMEEMLQHGHRLTSHEHSNHKDKHPTLSSSLEDIRSADVSAGESPCCNANLNIGSNGSLRDAMSSGGMRTKILSKSTGYPEYFVKNTLEGKGVLRRGPPSLGVDIRGQNAPCTPPMIPNSLNSREGAFKPSPHGSSTRELVNDGVNLREWIKSNQGKLKKFDGLCIFKEILDLVHSLHSDGKVLEDLRPSYFRLLPSKKLRYCGFLSETPTTITHKEVLKSQSLKRPLEQGTSTSLDLGAKHKKSTNSVNLFKAKPQFDLECGLTPLTDAINANLVGSGESKQGKSNRLHLTPSPQQHAFSIVDQLEEKWYKTPEEVFGRGCTSSSNIYCLGVFLFELLSSFDSGKSHAAAMSDLRHRILPPTFLSENPKEAGFCLWLLHPEPSLRPNASDILQSEVISGLQELCEDDRSSSLEQDEEDSELLLHFLLSMKEQKQKQASKLIEDLGCIEADVDELGKRHLLQTPLSLMNPQGEFLHTGETRFCGSNDIGDSRFSRNVSQLERAYFSARSQMQDATNDYMVREDRDILKNRDECHANGKDEEQNKALDDRGAFFDGLCKYARYTKLEVCGTLRNREITNSTNVICSLSFDRDEDYFAAAGVSKKIKIFDFQALCDDSVDIHYPMIEMSNKSKLSCVCWNSYVRNYLASTDYDGIVKLWDASTGQEFSQYAEHEKRAWSVDFSQLDPTKLASGSDDCSVKLWSINERNCLRTIRNIANVCCVQFSAHSSHLLAYGSADYKIYCYDLRNTNVPWCVLAGHEKAVSYVKFVDSGTLVSASTDNTLKLWDLNRSSSVGLSDNACSLTLKGHTNEKNFVGLSVADGYIACGSETNEVYTYYKSLPMPITSHNFGSIDPITGKETDDDSGQFVSNVCWKGKSNVVVAANSSGCIKVLQMV